MLHGGLGRRGLLLRTWGGARRTVHLSRRAGEVNGSKGESEVHPLYMDQMVEDRQCDLYAEAKAAGGPAHLKGTGGRLRRMLSGRRRERDLRTVEPRC